MKVGVPKETAISERRVALVPDTVGRLVKGGVEVLVQRGAGEGAFCADELYRAAGATLVPEAGRVLAEADVVVKVQRPAAEEAALLRAGVVLISFLQAARFPELVRQLAQRRVTAFSMERVPRLTRAQSMDALSSQATVAGYKAVLVAAAASSRLLPMLTTAAGTLAPAKGVGLGAGAAPHPGSEGGGNEVGRGDRGPRGGSRRQLRAHAPRRDGARGRGHGAGAAHPPRHGAAPRQPDVQPQPADPATAPREGWRACGRSRGRDHGRNGRDPPGGHSEPLMSGISFIELYVFVLAAFVGYQVISRVPPLLHTPLMSATNAISGISLVGSLVLAGADYGTLATWLGFIAVTSSSLNVIGGVDLTLPLLPGFMRSGAKRGCSRPPSPSPTPRPRGSSSWGPRGRRPPAPPRRGP